MALFCNSLPHHQTAVLPLSLHYIKFLQNRIIVKSGRFKQDSMLNFIWYIKENTHRTWLSFQPNWWNYLLMWSVAHFVFRWIWTVHTNHLICRVNLAKGQIKVADNLYAENWSIFGLFFLFNCLESEKCKNENRKRSYNRMHKTFQLFQGSFVLNLLNVRIIPHAFVSCHFMSPCQIS